MVPETCSDPQLHGASQRLNDLAFKLADEAARSSIECLCVAEAFNGDVWTVEGYCWYDFTDVADVGSIDIVREAVEYLSGRDLLVYHSINNKLIRVKDQDFGNEDASEDSRPQVPRHIGQQIVRYGDLRAEGNRWAECARQLAEVVQSIRSWGAQQGFAASEARINRDFFIGNADGTGTRT